VPLENSSGARAALAFGSISAEPYKAIRPPTRKPALLATRSALVSERQMAGNAQLDNKRPSSTCAEADRCSRPEAEWPEASLPLLTTPSSRRAQNF
jgi:hypothetical protein